MKRRKIVVEYEIKKNSYPWTLTRVGYCAVLQLDDELIYCKY
jgi:hypothetical protein